eukprot:3077213-Alexandrium_andersonii.AAC.1
MAEVEESLRIAAQPWSHWFKPTTQPNIALAEIQKGPSFHMDEAAVPAGPTGRNVLVQGLESTENGDPF